MRHLRGPHGFILLLVFTVVCGAGTVNAQQTHTVRDGETLYRIAEQYDTTVDSIRVLNDLQGSTIQVGQELVISRRADVGAQPPEDRSTEEESTEAQPAQDEPAAETEANSPENPSPTTSTSDGDHVVEAGETLFSIAARYDISVDTLMSVNPSIDPGEPLAEGRGLTLPEQFQTSEYTVRSGNTLGSIARKYGVSINAIRRANDIRGDRIQVGQVLTIPSRAVPEPSPRGTVGPADTTGSVHVYSDNYEGRLTASGEAYDPGAYTASHPSLPFGTVLLLTRSGEEASIFVRVNDRGPVNPGAMIDISRAAANVLGVTGGSEEAVELRRVE